MKTRYLVTVAGAMILAFAGTGCTGGSSNSNAPTTNTTSNSSSPVVQPEIYAQRKSDVAAVNQAVQQYHASEGHYPASLQELTPNYIARLPQAPAGYQYNYDANSGAVNLVKQ